MSSPPVVFENATCSADVQKLLKSALNHAQAHNDQKYICTDDLLWALHAEGVDGRRIRNPKTSVDGERGVWDLCQFTHNVHVVLEAARQKALREQNSNVVGTEDLLWAMFHSPTMEDRATKLLRAKGINRDSVWSNYSFSNNVHLMLDVARKQAEKTGSSVIGTEDLLWAMFNSPSIQNRAVDHLKSKGITGSSVWGIHKFTPNVHRLLAAAQAEAALRKEEMIGTEDMLHALFHTPHLMDSRATTIMQSKGLDKTALYSDFRYTDNAQMVLDRARQQAIQHGAEFIGTEDILQSLMSFGGNSRAAKFLRSLGVPDNITAYPTIVRTKLDQEMKQEDLSKVFVIGGLSGAIEVFIQQPLISWKTALQRGEGLPMDPRVWFRGVGVNASSIAPITAVQYSADAGLMQLLMMSKNWTRSEVPSSYKLCVAAAAGAMSGVVVTPAELIMISQQCTGEPVLSCVQNLGKVGISTFMRGFTPTLLRETGWTMSFLGLAPTVKEALQDDSKFFRSSEFGASIVSSVIAGLVAAVLTQPVDTIKTRMQADSGLHGPIKHKTTWSTGRQIIRERGVLSLYNGLVPRSVRIAGAVFILGEAAALLTRTFDKFSGEKTWS